MIGKTIRAQLLLTATIGLLQSGASEAETLAASMTPPVDTLSDEIEPYLLREQFIVRSPRGRVATAPAPIGFSAGP